LLEELKPFEAHESGALLHGTKADLQIGDFLVSGRMSNYEEGRTTNYVYVSETLDAAAWGAELAVGTGQERVYIVEPTGELEDDPNVTDKKFPGNPTRPYRTSEPVKVVGELIDWVGHTSEQQKRMRDGLAELKRKGAAVIYD
jgi:rifampin ADP-ribosylating transferase